MSWMDDRDVLIAETLAFVNEVAGSWPETPQPLQIVPAEQIKQTLKPLPNDFEPAIFERIAPRPQRTAREEIAERLASYRATQLKFQREREQYCSTTLTDALNMAGVPSPENGGSA